MKIYKIKKEKDSCIFICIGNEVFRYTVQNLQS